MIEWGKIKTNDTKPITPGTLKDAFEAMYKYRPQHICPPHIVHPRAYFDKDGYEFHVCTVCREMIPCTMEELPPSDEKSRTLEE